MPTAGELTIIIEAQDRASAQLRAVGQDVQRLERQVEGATRSTRGLAGVFGSLRQGLSLGVGFGAIQAGLSGLGRAWDLLSDSILGANSRLEQQRGTLRALTGSAEEAERILDQLRREADITPFDTQEMLAAGAALTAVARTARVDVMEMVRTAEILAAFRPEQGLEGAARALSEAIEGNLQSITERFGVTSAAIQRFRAQGLSTFEAVNAAMREMGLNSRIIRELANTFPGLTSNVVSFFNEFRRRLGEGVFLRAEEGLRALTGAIARNGDAVLAWASRVGSVIGALVARVGAQLGELAVHFLNLIQPGLGEEARALFSGVAESVDEVGQATERATPQVQALDRALSLPQAQQALQAAGRDIDALNSLAAQTNRPVADLTRELGRIGVQAAEVQLEAGRVRDAYDRQLQPLERQLRLLQQSADLQRVQNALATNRGAVERLRLEREILALQRAAGGAEDPAAAGLTVRQRVIALALQERQLRLEELGLEEERRPLLQTLEQQLAALQEQQRQALAPLEAQLAVYRDQVDVLQLQRQRWEVLRGDIQATIDLVNANPIRPEVAGPDEGQVGQRQAEYLAVGERMAAAWLKGWQDEVDANGGNIWVTLGNKLERWYEATGKPLADRVGADLGAAVGTAAGAAAASAFGETLRRRLFEGPSGAEQTAAGILAGVPPERRQPTTLPTVSVPIPEAIRGPGPETHITINVAELPGSPGFQQRLQAAFTDFWRQFLQAEAQTDPGASSRLQGSGRAP